MCLDALMPQLASVDGAVVTVVDNGSTDGSIAAVTTRFPTVRFVPLQENRGFTGGIAAGLVRSVARNVIFLNNDAIPEPNWLPELVSAIDEAPDDVISAGGKIIDTTGTLIDFIGGVMTFDGHAFQNGFRFPLGSREEPASGADIFFACGGNMISRRAPLLDLGGFDDDYFAYLEDVDFGWRSWISGFRHIFAARAVVRHHSSATSNRLGNFERGVLFERNALQTAMKNYDDDLLREISGSIFFTYLHRLHHYATTRNTHAGELTRTPFGPAATVPPPRSRSLKHRIRRRIAGREGLATIDDPLTAMQFRAFDWIVKNSARIAEKRLAVQRRRKRTDREVFERFPLHFVATYPGDDELLRNPLFRILRPAVASAERELGDIIRT
jgi:GT2 family glycosyltransferase